MTDAELVKRCTEKDPAAQKLLFERFERKMFGICLRYAARQEEAEDMVQNGFIKVFENIHTFRAIGSLEGWIRRIVINEALSYIRKYKNTKHQINIDDAERLAPEPITVSETINAKELLKIIQSLPAGFRTVFNLHAIEGYTHKEIGEMLGISEGTSKSQYARARAHLQKLVQGKSSKEESVIMEKEI